MKQKILIVFLIILLIPSVLVGYSFLHSEEDGQDFFVGVDVAYDDLNKIKGLIDEVSSYTNLFVIGSSGISYNETRLSATCQYLFDRDMCFIIYSDSRRRLELIRDIGEKYPNHFLGVYFYDEQGGRQLDSYEYTFFYEAENYSNAANLFLEGSDNWLNRRYTNNETGVSIAPSDFKLFTSDYALYWFDYLAGYDAVFAQFGWNYSRQLNVAFCRGAATVHSREWGVIVTWTYNNPPYIESGRDLYSDLILAYENGAKYILVFDSNEEYSQGILKEEHFEALEQFWQYTSKNPRNVVTVNDRIAYVLPKDYGYGFRGPNDKIWGLWEADDLSLEISTNIRGALEEYGTSLDIIYDDGIEFDKLYSKYIFWNGTIYDP